MQNTVTLPPLGPTKSDGKTTFNVVIAYEDFETGKNAKKTYDFMAEHLGDEFQVDSQMWKFDVLSIKKLREMAAHDAADADIVIVSAHGSSELPGDVKSWLEMSFAEGLHAIGLVGLFDERAYQENPTRTYLASLAETANLDFFSQPGKWPGETSAAPSVPNWEGNSKPLSLLTGFSNQNRNVSHWGINE